ARTVLGVEDVVLEAMDTAIGSAGSTSASRQTWMSGGAVDAACRKVRERLYEHVGAAHGLDPLRLTIEGTDVVDTMGTLRVPVVEEIVLRGGHVRNPSVTDYLLPTFLDAPEVVMSLDEEPDPQAPLGAKGVGAPPCISVTPAIVAAIRAATGAALPRVPVRTQD